MPSGPAIQNLAFTYRTALSLPVDVAWFAGNGSVSAGQTAFPSSQLTAELWLCTTQSDAGAVILSCDDGDAAHRICVQSPDDLVIAVGTASAAIGMSVADGQWHHLAITLSAWSETATSVGAYIDGNLVWCALNGIVRAPGAWPSAAATVTLGAGSSGYIGQASEFRLWGSVLSAQQISTGMDVRKPESGSGAVLVWPLDEDDPDAFDASEVDFQAGSPALQFFDIRELNATWDDAGAGCTYAVTLSGGGTWYPTVDNEENNFYSTTTFWINTQYTLTVIATLEGASGPAGSAAIATADLPVPAPAVDSPSTGTFQANWDAVDQASGYLLAVTPAGGVAASSSLDEPCADLSAQAFTDGSWTYTVGATATASGTGATTAGIQGPPTFPAAVPGAPTVALAYNADPANPDALIATLALPDPTLPYLLDLLCGAATVATPVLPPGTGSYMLDPTPAPDPQNPQTYTVTARAVPVGAIGPRSAVASATLYDINAPVITQVTGDSATNTVTVAFSFSDPAITLPVFQAQLLDADGLLLAESDDAVSPQALQSPAAVDGATLTVQVRASAACSYSPWAAESITIGGPDRVTGVSANEDASANITVNWEPVTQSGAAYVVKLYGADGSLIYTTAALSGTSANLPASATGAQATGTYYVTVTSQVTQGGVTLYGPPSSPVEVVPPPSGNTDQHADPIDVGNGSYQYSNDDITVAGVVPLVFTTRYGGAWPTHAENPVYPASPLGNRWTHSYMTQIATNGSYRYVLWADQRVECFQVPSSGTGAQIPAGTQPGTTLTFSGTAFTLTTGDDRVYTFDATGLMTSLSDRYGNIVQLGYSGGLLQTVTDLVSGRALALGYAGANLRTVSDAIGRTVTYDQDDGDLKTVTDPRGYTRTFDYTGASLMQSAVDGNGNQVMENQYGGTGTQVIKQQDARSLVSDTPYYTTFSYQDGTLDGADVTVTSGTDQAGNAFSYTTSVLTGATLEHTQALSPGQIFSERKAYDASNNLISKTVYSGPSAGYTQGTGNTTAYTYDGNGNCLSEITDLSADTVYAVSRTYDAKSNKLTESYYQGLRSGYASGAGNTWTYTYYDDNSLHTSTNPLGLTTTLTYWGHALPKTVTDGLGNVTSYVYDNGSLASVTNALGEEVDYDYDDIGRPTILTYKDAEGQAQATVDLTYNENSQVHTRTWKFAGQTAGYTTTFGYDGNGNVTSVQDASGNLTSCEYNPNNHVELILYAAFAGSQREVEYAYDPLNFLLSTTLTSTAAAPTPVTTLTTRDAMGRLLQKTDPDLQAYTYTDAMAPTGAPPFLRQAATTWPLLQTGDATYSEATTYDPLGRPLSFTGRDGQTISIAYSTRADAATGTLQAVATVTYPATTSQPATTQVIVQDAMGRTVSVTDQNQGVTTYAYTAAQGAGASAYAVVTVIGPGGDTAAYSFDAQKRQVQMMRGQNGLTRTQTFAYDCLGRLTSQTTAQGTSSYTTSYAYGLDNDTGTWTASIGRPGMTTGPTVQYYNGLAQLVKQVDPSGTTTTSTYTPWGALASYANGRGQTLNYDFDDAGRLKQTRFPDGTAIAYTLDGNGNRLTATQGGEVVSYQFDNWNRMKSRTGVEGALIQYGYWPTDQVQSLTYPDGKIVQYGIDALGRMTSVSDWSQPAQQVAYGYTVLNQLESITYPNGAASEYGYDGAGRLDSLAHTSGGLLIARWQAQYDALGQLSSATVIEPLVPAAPATGTSLTYTEGNQLETVDGAPAAFDADGNYLGTSSVTPSNGYDIFNRLTSLAGTNGTATFGYDPDGLRVNASAGSAQTNYVFDINAYQSPMVQRGDPVRALAGTVTQATAGIPAPDPFYMQGQVLAMTDAVDRLLEQRDSNQAVQTRFLHGQGLLGQWDAAGTGRYFHFDPVGNLWAMTDAATGTVTDAAVFGPFAQAFARSGSTDTPFRFSGQFGVMDDGTGALFARARSYDTTQMRFLQIDYLLGDPMSPQSLNPYAYALGNPAQASDPLGLDAWKWATGIGTAIGAGLIGGWIYSGGASAFFSGVASALGGLFGGEGGGGNGGGNGGSHGSEGGSEGGGSDTSEPGSDTPLIPKTGSSGPQSFEIEGPEGGYESDSSSEADETTGLVRRGSGGQRTFMPRSMSGGGR